MGTSGGGGGVVGGGWYLSDVILGLLQLVRLVGPEQLGLRLTLLLQHGLGVLPALPRLHTVIERTLRRDPAAALLPHTALIDQGAMAGCCHDKVCVCVWGSGCLKSFGGTLFRP